MKGAKRIGYSVKEVLEKQSGAASQVFEAVKQMGEDDVVSIGDLARLLGMNDSTLSRVLHNPKFPKESWCLYGKRLYCGKPKAIAQMMKAGGRQ